MPKAGQAGYSDNTPIKQEHFSTIIRTLCAIVRSIVQRYPTYAVPWFLYIDLNAGPGWYPDLRDLFHHGLLGSPLLALQAARAAALPLHGYLMDHDPQAIAALCQSLPLYGGLMRQEDTVPAIFSDPTGAYRMVVCPGDSAATMPRLLTMALQAEHQIYGVIYSDVNGGTVPLDELVAYSQALPLVDLVIHLSPTHRKRVHGRYHTLPPLETILPLIKKDYWVVRRPYRQEQWTFLIGTNWDSFPRFDRQGFVPTDSPGGRDILRRISYRTGEQP
jgi:hypothetical protein